MPQLTGPQGTLFAVSCVGSTFCMAVGNYESTTEDNSVPTAEVWHAGVWTLQNVPLPTDGIQAYLDGVTCLSKSSCVAVGGDVDTATETYDTVVESWNGTAWTVVPSASPAGAYDMFASISCSSADDCLAVGFYLSDSLPNYLPLSEQWNGTAWSVLTTPLPAGEVNGFLGSVSCTPSGTCTAVGDADTGNYSSGPYTALVETWNGTAWSAIDAPTPSGASESELNGVFCLASGGCETVGFYTGASGNQHALAEQGAGAAWTLQTVPDPAKSTLTELSGVDCSSAGQCETTGYYVTGKDQDGPSKTLAEGWNGTSWMRQVTPTPAGEGIDPPDNEGVGGGRANTGISCGTATTCTAVWFAGSYKDPLTMAAAWNGTHWKLQTTANPTGPASSTLYAVSCSSAKACTAVGYTTAASGAEVTLAEAWNGTTWSVQATPDPAGAVYPELDAVSCPSADWCTAVGQYTTSLSYTTTYPIVEVWNGTSWSIQPIPTTEGPTTALDGVSCTLPDACMAVGWYLNGGAYLTYAVYWDGTTWTNEFTPVTPSNNNYLGGVSCLSADDCEAVGQYIVKSADYNLAESWNGSMWSIQATPNPSGGTGTDLDSVSCAAPDACAAVGSYDNGSGTSVTLAESFNGTSWTLVPTPLPPTAIAAAFFAVSCSAGDACTAVGYQELPDEVGAAQTLAETWNGSSWSQQSIVEPDPTPDNAFGANADGVSCTPPTACTAVGGIGDDVFGTGFPFAESES